MNKIPSPGCPVGCVLDESELGVQLGAELGKESIGGVILVARVGKGMGIAMVFGLS